MKKVLLIVSLVLLSIQVRANQLYGWVGKSGEGENYFILDKNSSSAGSLADIVSITLLMPYTGETTYTLSSPMLHPMALGSTFAWSSAQITAMSLTFTPPKTQLANGDVYWCDITLANGRLWVGDSYVHGGMISYDDWVDDSTGSWLAFNSLADYEAALAVAHLTAPESGNTALLLLGALAGMLVWRRCKPGHVSTFHS